MGYVHTIADKEIYMHTYMHTITEKEIYMHTHKKKKSKYQIMYVYI